ncbi:10041_t:CDS:1, partial [Funneliformis caledonium]
VSSYIIKPDDIISVLGSFQADTSYPSNLNRVLQPREISMLVEYLSNYLRFVANDASNVIDVIKHLPIFSEVGNATPISLIGNQNWYLLPYGENNSYGEIIYPSERGKFLNSASPNLRYILEDIIKVPRLDSYNYWQNYVIPFLKSQPQRDIDIIIDKLLFDKSPSLLNELKDSLGETSFIPVGTLEMSQQKLISSNIKLANPTELFDPEDEAIISLFFEDEHVFPTGKYGDPRYFSSLKFLGMKSILSPNDIISRINTIVTRVQNPAIDDDLIRTKALNLFKYLDERWDQLNDNSYEFMYAILRNEWIPTIDNSGRHIFSRLKNCYCKKYKNLVGLIAPTLDYDASNYEFLKILEQPDIKMVLKQLEICYNGLAKHQTPDELKIICNAIYEYMNKLFHRRNFRLIIKLELEHKPWIFYGNQFYTIDKIFTRLPNEFKDNGSLIELPLEYAVQFGSMFKSMGVQDEIGVNGLILIINNMVKGDENRILSTKEVQKVIQFLERIATLQMENRREGKSPESLDGLLIPSTDNKLVN